jgi:Holliday junction resolvase RusA-like endonuclease
MAEFTFTIPGRAPSVNHMYAPGRTFGSRRKAPGVEDWQTKVAQIVRVARPSGWAPQGQVRLVFDFHLNREADLDNLFKALLDAIAAALGVNDRIFLPCARSKTKVATADERIVITVSDA